MNEQLHRVRLSKLVPIAIAALAAASCAGPQTSIEATWVAPGARSQQLQRVVTLFAFTDGAQRRSTEDRLANELRARGIEATPAYAVLAGDEVEDPELARSRLLSQGYDGIVAMRLVDKEQTLEYAPGDFDAYWGYAWPALYWPGYAYTETVLRMETNAYRLSDNKLVWSTLSKTVFDPTSSGYLENATDVVTRQLEASGVFAMRATPPRGNLSS
ncbi:MAG: hypothetical protein ACTHU0_32190 [Kofleriaceae bacterium]